MNQENNLPDNSPIRTNSIVIPPHTGLGFDVTKDFVKQHETNFVIEAMAEVGKELRSVSMRNMQRYKARHIYDVYNNIQPLLAKHGVMIGRKLISEEHKEVKSAKGTTGTHRYQMWEFTFHCAKDKSTFSTTFPAESIDWGDKSASQCDAMAYKQMLIHTFLIPTEDMIDPDDGPAKINKPPAASQAKTQTGSRNQPKASNSGGAAAPKNFAPGVDNKPNNAPAKVDNKNVENFVEYVIPWGKYSKGKKFSEVKPDQIKGLMEWCEGKIPEAKTENYREALNQYIKLAGEYLSSIDEIPF